jgi:mannose-6-phosphate isomerase
MNTIYPLRFNPVYKDYIWGGTRIPRLFNRSLSGGLCAESWEISTHPDGMTVIANGPLAGKTLLDLLPEHKTALLGTAARGGDFPLLIKLIDARDTLSVQVHPGTASAAAVKGDPKTEMWYFLDAAKGAQVYCGFKPGTSRAEFLEAMKNKTADGVLQSIPAEKGGAVYVPGGRVHAIGAGCLILEIQQNSNTTYRIYDWDRPGADGRPRELHIEKALQVIDWDDRSSPACVPQMFAENGIQGFEIKTAPWFRLDRFELSGRTVFPNTGKSFHALFVAEGAGTVSWAGGAEKMITGQSWLMPAALSAYTVSPGLAALTLLRVTVPGIPMDGENG